MGVAGSVARRGGMRAIFEIQQASLKNVNLGSRVDQGVKSFRKIERYMDELQGVTRAFHPDESGNDILIKKLANGRLARTDDVVKTDGANFRIDNPERGEWAIRDEIQQRMVRQARRLPYEIPGFYAAQKLVLDPLLGNNQDDEVNWSNPIDVIGDFASESIKNIAANVIPFEAAGGAARQGYRQLANRIAHDPGPTLGVHGLDYLLEQVGASSVDILNKTLKMSHQTIGGFSGLIRDSIENSKTTSQWIRQASVQPTHQRPAPHGNASAARRWHERAKDALLSRDLRASALDAMPGPFKGMNTAIQNLKGPNGTWNRMGQTYDDWQAVVSGRVPIESFKKDARRYGDLMSFMQKGGGTYIEKYARDTNSLLGYPTVEADGSVKPGGFRGSEFYKTRKNDVYKQVLVDNMIEKTGLRPDQAVRFVNKFDQITPFTSSKSKQSVSFGQNIMDRFKFGSEGYHGEADDWWQNVVNRARSSNIDLENGPQGKIGFNHFRDAVKKADRQFSQPDFFNSMDRNIGQQWQHLFSTAIPKQASAGLKGSARPFESVSGKALKSNKEWMIRRSAERLKISSVDDAGRAKSLIALENEIKSKGLNSSDLRQVRGFLMDQKDISAPWTRMGRNLFGFKPLSVGQAVDQGYFSAQDAAEQSYIKQFVNYKVGNSIHADPGGAGQAYRLKTGGVYTHSDGTVVDLGRIGRSVRSFYDAMASETAIPILNLNPLQILGSNAKQAQRRSRSVKIMSGLSHQPLINPGAQTSPPDFYLWLRTQGRGDKGKVSAVTGGTSNEFSGTYNSWTTNSRSMLGRYGRLFAGDMGLPSTANAENIEGQNLKSRFRRMFDISYDQESSVFFGEQSLLRRWRGARKGKGTRNANPNALAQSLARGEVNQFGPNESVGLENLVRMLRNFGFSDNTMRAISKDPQFADAFGPLGGRGIFDISENELPRLARELIDKDNVLFQDLAPTSATSARKLQQHLKNLIRQGTEQDDFWNLPTSDQAKSIGVSRRIDQLRSELSNYLLASSNMRQQLTRGNIGQEVATDIPSLYGKIDELFKVGTISGREKSEARAAVLGLQIDQMRNKAYSEIRKAGRDVPLLDLNRATAEAIASSGPQTRQALSEVGGFYPGTGDSFTKDFVSRIFNRNTTTVGYRNEAANNPIGSEHLLVPNFATVSQNQGMMSAMKGVFASWSDPKAVSTMSAPATHAALRLNRYMESFGIGLDPTRYRGPIDYYARGLIGRRVAPAYIGGVSLLAVDRTLGGMVNQDENGNPIYSPLVLGMGADVVAAGQVGLAGVVPGGQSASEKREELESGEVPIRQGRYWLMGNTPFKGGRIQYYRPSWYQRLKAGAAFSPEMNETPLERLAFGYDFSPLRPLDPYRREREDAQSRPYPVSGDYFTGPWGALNPVLNSTIGRVLKPRRYSDQTAVSDMVSQYAAVGDNGVYYNGQGGGGTYSVSGANASASLSSINQSYSNMAGSGGSSVEPFYGSMGYAPQRGFASQHVRDRATSIATMYSNAAGIPGSHVTVSDMLVPYGVPTPRGQMPQRILPGGEVATANPAWRELAFRTQETLGIYGFGLGAVRSSLGFGSQDFTPNRTILEPSHRGYSSSRAFWNLNIGGMGDVPIPMLESRYSNFEVSEIIRRFVPKDPQGINYINDMPNLMGQMYPWLPGNDYPLNSVKTGDPYSFADAEIRLPGTGYARTHDLFPDRYGQIGLANIHDILADVAPWSEQFDQVDALVSKSSMSPLAQAKVSQTRAQVESMRIKNEFTPYEYKYSTPGEMLKNPYSYGLGRGWEWLSHRDTFFNDKFLPERTALEDWERDNVYGATFPSWQSPIESYISPFVHKSTQRDPFTAIAGGGTFGMLFGKSPRAKAAGALLGAITGAGASAYGYGHEAITGDRFMPAERRKEVALEEYADILKYTHSVVNASNAYNAGNSSLAQEFIQESKKTMFGVDLNSTPEQIAQALPSRKREHFLAMLYAPIQERDQIMSTAGRLERRLYQAAWGMQVEARPDLPEYFEDHELPSAQSEFWSPLNDIDNVKIKIGQHLGLDMTQMGYYTQQIQEANLVNPSYPDMFRSSSSRSVASQLRELMYMNGSNGSVAAYPNMFGENRVQLTAGVF